MAYIDRLHTAPLHRASIWWEASGRARWHELEEGAHGLHMGGIWSKGKQERGGIGAHGFSSSFPPILRHCVTVKLFWEILNTQQMYLLSKLIHFFQSCHGPVASVVTHFTLLHILSCFAQVFLTLACVRIIHPCPLQKAPVLISRFRLGCLGNLG